MKRKNKKVLSIIVFILFLFSMVNLNFADVYYFPNNNPYYPNYPNFYPNYYPYGNQNGYYAFSRDGSFVIPYDSYYYMIGYDRQVYVYGNGEVMQSRVPVLAGNYPYPTQIANRLIYAAYVSISNWCNDNIYDKANIQDYYLNYATVESVSPTQVVLLVDCGLKKKGVIDGYEKFRVTINIQSGRYTWRNVSNNGKWLYGDGKVYEFDSERGNIIIIQ